MHKAARGRLIIMVKEPRLGRVKTRLASEIGAVQATRFYRTTAAAIIRRLACDCRWQTMLAVTPDTAVASTVWPRHLPRVVQAGGDIGERMARLLAMSPHGPVVLIGSDIPGVRVAHIAAAFRVLAEGNEVVFGPAEDGGFWLVGVKRARDVGGLFTNVRWSGPHALADVLANLGGRSAGFAAQLADVDDAAALHRAGRRRN